MVTRLSDTVVDTAIETQFRYDVEASSGLDMVVSGGVHFEDSTGAVTFTQQTFTLADDTTNFIVLDFDDEPATFKAVTQLPDLPFILYRVVTSSGSISSVNDLRWKATWSRLVQSGTNSLLATTAAVADHYFNFKEGTTHVHEDREHFDQIADIGVTGTTSSVSLCLQLPGPARGLPYNIGGISKPWDGGHYTSAGISSPNFLADHSVGGFGIWVRFDDFDDHIDPAAMFGHIHDNSAVVYFMQVNTDGKIEGGIDNGSNHNWVTTDSSHFSNDHVWHFVYMQQKGDSNGISIFVDGVSVAVTTTLAGTADNNTWVDDLYVANDPTELKLFNHGGGHGSQDSQWRGNIALPFFLVGNTMTDAQVLEIYDSAELGGETKDVREWIMDNIDPLFYVTASSATTSHRLSDLGRRGVSLQVGSAEAANVVTGGFTNTSINHYHNGAWKFDVGFFETISPASSDTGHDVPLDNTQGTWTFWIRTPGDFSTDRNFNSYGTNSSNWFRHGHDASGQFQHQIYIDGTGNFYLQVCDGNALSINTFYMLTVTQTGSAIKMYINADLQSGADITESTAGTGVDETSWHNDFLGPTNAGAWRISGSASGSSIDNWEDGRIADILYHEIALTDQQVTDMYNATQGVFA